MTQELVMAEESNFIAVIHNVPLVLQDIFACLILWSIRTCAGIVVINLCVQATNNIDESLVYDSWTCKCLALSDLRMSHLAASCHSPWLPLKEASGTSHKSCIMYDSPLRMSWILQEILGGTIFFFRQLSFLFGCLSAYELKNMLGFIDWVDKGLWSLAQRPEVTQNSSGFFLDITTGIHCWCFSSWIQWL